jgi:hypothetical protein
MRPISDFDHLRIRTGPIGTTTMDGRNGLFEVESLRTGRRLSVIISDGADWEECGLPGEPWEHVSVSLPSRCPNWQEMSVVKDVFFGPDETVVQFHVPASEHISHHPYCLHLWKPPYPLPLPPSVTVGPRGLGDGEDGTDGL